MINDREFLTEEIHRCYTLETWPGKEWKHEVGTPAQTVMVDCQNVFAEKKRHMGGRSETTQSSGEK